MDMKIIFGKKKQNEDAEEEHKHEAIEKDKTNYYKSIDAIIHKDGKFLEVICRRCRNKQIVYGKSTTDVKCLKCNKLLVKTGGGKARIVTFIRRVLIWR